MRRLGCNLLAENTASAKGSYGAVSFYCTKSKLVKWEASEGKECMFFFPHGIAEGKESVRLCISFSLQWSAFNRLRSQTVIVYSTGIPLTSKAAGNLLYEALFINPESNCVVCEPALEARLLSY